jgi:tetratricopeptide (TPR) repeat protein
MSKGEPDSAIADYNAVIEDDVKRGSLDRAKSADQHNRRAWAYFKAGRAAEGLADAERSLELWPGVAAALDTRGHIVEALGRKEEAIADFRRALAKDPNIQESKDALARLGASVEAADALNVLHERILELDHANKFPDAIAAAKEYVALVEARRGSGHLDLAFGLEMLAELYEVSQNPQDAEPYVRRALTIREVEQGANHLETARTINNLAAVLEKRGEYTEAEALARRALTIRETGLGGHHQRVAESLNNLAVILFRQDRLREAEALSLRAVSLLETDRKPLGPPGQRLFAALNNLATIHQKQKRDADAAAVFRRSLVAADLASRPTRLGMANRARVGQKADGIVNRRADRGRWGKLSPGSKGTLRRSRSQSHSQGTCPSCLSAGRRRS